MAKVITCTVCEEPYDLEDHEPVALPACGHSFCRQCLIKLKRENAVLRCPNCRAEHNGCHPLDLPTNFSLLSCIEDQLKENDRNLQNSTSVTSKTQNKNSKEDLKKEGDRNLPKSPEKDKSSEKDRDSEKDSDENGGSNLLKIGICTTVGAVGAIALAPVALAGVGFTSAGIAGGSWAASMMSASAIANGGGVAAGGLVATLQSMGAVGIGAGGSAVVGSVGGAVGGIVGSIAGAFTNKKKDNKDEKSNTKS